MHKLVSSISVIVISIIVLSCSDNFLNPDPRSFLDPDNIYVDDTGLRALIITMSKDIRAEHYSERSTMDNEYAISDLGVPGAQAAAVVKDFPQNLTPAGDGGNHDFPGRLFNQAYNSIRNTNTLISRVDLIEWDSESIRNQLLAEAYFYRSYWYYRLVNSYGDVPFIGEEIREPKLDFYTHSRWAILEKIEEDLEWAVNWLPETADPGQATRGAGNHLLTKIHLRSE